MKSSVLLPEIETQSQAAITLFQEGLLRRQLAHVHGHSPFYGRVFREHGIDVASIRTIGDLAALPVTTKDDLQKHNAEFYCVPRNRVIDYTTTSGTLGEPVTFIMTENDLQRLAYNEAISLSCAGCSSEDVFHLATTIDRRFMAGLAYFLGARRMGAGVVRVGNGIPEFQWESILRMAPTAIIAVPSFLVRLLEYAEENGIDVQRTSLTKAICIGDPLREQDFSLNALGKRIAAKWGIQLFSTYASTEMGTAFTECGEAHGCHHHPELIIVEFLDDDNTPVGEGEPGEITVTTLGVEGMPLVRFKTGDLCYRYTSPCACGRTTMRLGPVLARKQQMIKYKGTTLYPAALFEILDGLEMVANYYIEVSTNDMGNDEITAHVGVKRIDGDTEKMLKDHFRSKVRVAPHIVLESPQAIEQVTHAGANRKARIFLDRRERPSGV